MSDLGRDKLPTLVDIAWQILFRLGFPVARIWWRLQRRRHVGALVAIHVGHSLLLLRSSYRSAWNFPGGSVRQGETPEVSVRRELAEEIGLVANAPLQLVGEVCGVWDGRIDRVFLFVLRLDRLPTLQPRDSRNGLGGGNGGLFRDAGCLAVPRANSFGTGDIFGDRLTQPIHILRHGVRLSTRHCDSGFVEGIEDGDP